MEAVSRKRQVNRALLLFSILFVCLIWPVAGFLLLRMRANAFGTSAFLLGLSLGPCLTGYALARPERKQTWRRLVLLSGGLSIAALSWLGRMNLELEGCFMLLISGTMGAAIGHTVVTLILGPLFFGRFLCGWGCWRSMVFEWVPVDYVNRASDPKSTYADPHKNGDK